MWQKISSMGEDETLPGRVFIRVEGWQEHSGGLWKRIHYDIVYTSNGNWKISETELKRIMYNGDMEGIDEIYWHKCMFPSFP